MAGDTEFLSMYLLSNRHAKSVPIFIAGLFMRGYRIVNDRPHPINLKILLQRVAPSTEDRKDVIHASRLLRQSHQRIADMIYIIVSNGLSASIIVIQTFQLHTEYSSLNLINT